MPIKTAAEIWRPYDTAGVPASGPAQPVKSDIVLWGTLLETMLNGGAPGLAYATRAAINGDLAHTAGVTGLVYADPTPANNGLYVKSGGSGAGAWTRIGDLPNAIVPLTVTGGTANALQVTATETPTVPGSKLYLLTPNVANTGATTIALNGGIPAAVKNAFGLDLAANSLVNNQQVLMAWSVDHYQLLISAQVDASAILASALAAQSAAAASAAAASADAAALGNQVHQYDTRADAIAATIPGGVDLIRTLGYGSIGIGGALLQRDAGPLTSTAAIQSADGAWWKYVPVGGRYDVQAYGSTGAGSSHADDTYINSALVDIRAAGKPATLWFPGTAGSYWVTSAIDVRATSNLTIDGDPGTTIKASSAFDASDNNSKSSVISGLNFTGTATQQGYLYSRIKITGNIIVDGSNQNVAGLPPAAIGGFGYNMCSVELMNVDDAEIHCTSIGAFGNGPVISTHDPRLTAPSIISWTIPAVGSGYAVGDTFKPNGGTYFAGSQAVFRVTSVNGLGGITGLQVINRGIYLVLPSGAVATTTLTGSGSGATINITGATVFNGCRNPKITGNIIDCCRGLLPSYSQVGDVGGIAGSGLQIGAATNILIDVRVTRVGGPCMDVFNVNGGFVRVECDSVSSTPIGSLQKRGVIHSDFGAQNIKFVGRAPSVDMRGAMQSGTSYFFNGGTPSQGPTNCTFDIVVEGFNAADGNTNGVILAGGSVSGTVGNVLGCKGRFVVINAQGIAFALYDGRYNDFVLQVFEPGTTAGQYKCVSLNAQVNQAGGGCAHNSFTLMSRDFRALLESNFVDDGTGLNSANTIWGNEHLNATTGTSINLPGGTYTLK